ncbi:MAG: molybdenum cofactor guanylyltransferase [Desulfonatronovibrio sp.]|nr:molybdenum cofactor guanylyltransferase [Desulfovibrionales bacterium]
MNSAKKSEICGIVLAGGKSSRLGQDKTRIIINGQTLLERMLSLTEKFCDKTFCVGRDAQNQGINFPWILDKIPGIGPMGGILTALQKFNSPCLILACDLPKINQEIIQRLISHRNLYGKDKYMTTFYQKRTGFIEALVSIYEPRCADLLLASLNQGCYKLSRAVPYDNRCHIAYGPEEEEYFFNINYPHDLSKLNKGEDSVLL